MGCANSRLTLPPMCINSRDLCDQNRKNEGTGLGIKPEDGLVEIFHKLDADEKNYVFRPDLVSAIKASDMYKRFGDGFQKMLFDMNKESEDAFVDLYEYLDLVRKHIPPYMIQQDRRSDYSEADKTRDHKKFRPLEVFAFMDQIGDRRVSAADFKLGLSMTDYVLQVDKDIWDRNWKVLIWKVQNDTHDVPSKSEIKKLQIKEESLAQTWLDFDHLSRWYRNLREFEELREELKKGTGSGTMNNAFGLEYDSDDDTATNSLIMKAVHKTLLVDKETAHSDFYKIWNAYDKDGDHILNKKELLKLLSDLLYGLRDHVHKMKLAKDKTGFWNQKQHLLRQEVEAVRRNIMHDPQALIEKFFSCFNVGDAQTISEKHMWKNRMKLCDFVRSRLRQFEMHLARAMQAGEIDSKGI
mmetsp:Transcript_32617/g.52836  ORF Transcript_32617/g.52836 Transcript_32617/m.52836 type:complete len:411 (+) Transcript_32617:122-1354(+)